MHVSRGALESMPDMATEEEYESIPVEAFGEAMLRGMGWTEGRALGRRDMEVGAACLETFVWSITAHV